MNYVDKYATTSNADLRTEAALNDLQNKIHKSAKVKEPTLPKFISTKKSEEKPAYDSYQKLADKDRMDMAIELQLKNISDHATKKPSDIKSEPLSNVTRAMIEDFQAEQNQPIEIGGVKYKYHPAGADTLVFDTPVFGKQFRDKDIKKATKAIIDLTAANDNINDNIKLLNEAFVNMKNEYDIKMAEASDITKYSTDKKRLKRQKELNKLLDKTTKSIEMDIEKNKINLASNESIIQNIEIQLKDNEEMVKKNEQEKYNVEQVNRRKLKDLTDNLNALNKGRASAEQMVGESNEDYLLRLQNIETTPYSVDELRDLANIKNIGTTKQNLKSFFSDDGRTSTIAKCLSPDEKFMFNKLFLKIKKKYLETYGFDNKQISNQDVVDFINKIEDQPVVQIVAAQAVPALLPAPAPATVPPPPVLLPKPPPPPTPKVKSIAAPLSPDDAELATKYPGPPASGLKLWASDNGISEVKPRMIIDEVIDTLFKKQIPVPEYFISRFHGEIAKAQARTNNQILMAVSGSGLKIKKKSKAAIQGVNVRDIPPLMKFVKLYITADQLYFNNLLGIRNKSNRQVTGIPNVMVSDT